MTDEFDDDDAAITPIEVPRNVTAPCLLIELEPAWIVESENDQRKVGLKFLCPCHSCHGWNITLAIRFVNPIGGGPPSVDRAGLIGNNDGKRWTRSGDTFETLTISPSIDATLDAAGNPLPPNRKHWHGMIANGHVT